MFLCILVFGVGGVGTSTQPQRVYTSTTSQQMITFNSTTSSSASQMPPALTISELLGVLVLGRLCIGRILREDQTERYETTVNSSVNKYGGTSYYSSENGQWSCQIEEIGGFLKYKCRDDYNHTFFKCSHTDQFYNFTQIDAFRYNPRLPIFDSIFTSRCDNDKKFYQACGTGNMSIISESTTFCGRKICSYKRGRLNNVCSKYAHIGRRIPQKSTRHVITIGEANPCEITDVPDEEINNNEEEDDSTENEIEDTCSTLNFPDTSSCMREAVCKNLTFGLFCDGKELPEPVKPTVIFRLASCENSAFTDQPTINVFNSTRRPSPNITNSTRQPSNTTEQIQQSDTTERPEREKFLDFVNMKNRIRGKLNRQGRSTLRERNIDQTIGGCHNHGKHCNALDIVKRIARGITTQEDLKIFNFTRCNTFRIPLCKNGIDQIDCTDNPDQIGLWCDINGRRSSISKQRVCLKTNLDDLDPGPLCDDKLDMTCLACGVHKHKICDGVHDCRDKSDEIGCNLMQMAEKTCQRTGGNGTELPIPLEWLLDGQADCMNGIDESEENILSCGKGRLRRLTFNSYCENVFICKSGDKGYVQLDKLCDGTVSCNDERRVCAVSQDLPVLPVRILGPSRKLKKHMSYCLPGLEELQRQRQEAPCQPESFIFPDHNYFGITDRTEIMRPRATPDLRHLFGEHYVYSSCRGDNTESCPLRDIPYDSCPGQYRNRIGTFASNKSGADMSDNSYLTFFVKSSGDSYRNNFFVCDNGEKCIEYSKVCDLINDCADGSDEIRCKNHFSCSRNSTQKIFIPWTSYCDEKFDCPDLSDECNSDCSKQILHSMVLKASTITIGAIAVVANFVVIFNSFQSLSKCKTPIALANKSLVLLIGVGDFLIGGYLLLLTAADIFFTTMENGHTGYCRNQIKWLVSYKCDILGVFSTVGSQISLFAMTVLSALRLFGVLNSDRIQHRTTRKYKMLIGACVFLIIFSSFIIAVVPILPMDFFISGLAFQEDLKLFVGIKSREELFAVIREYFGRTRAPGADDKQWSWGRTEKFVRDMFDGASNETTNIEINRLGFYGNDGVCLFKFFVTPEDPQRHFVWFILIVNFICFTTISVCYITSTLFIRMTTFAAKALNRSGSTLSNVEKSHIKRQKSLQHKIAFIIFTDFICWIPFIIVCGLHYFKIISADDWYAFFSVIVLPINSIINPFLYDEVFTNALKGLWKTCRMHGITCSKLIEERRIVSSSGNSSVGSVAARPSSDPKAETPS